MTSAAATAPHKDPPVPQPSSILSGAVTARSHPAAGPCASRTPQIPARLYRRPVPQAGPGRIPGPTGGPTIAGSGRGSADEVGLSATALIACHSDGLSGQHPGGSSRALRFGRPFFTTRRGSPIGTRGVESGPHGYARFRAFLSAPAGRHKRTAHGRLIALPTEGGPAAARRRSY